MTADGDKLGDYSRLSPAEGIYYDNYYNSHLKTAEGIYYDNYYNSQLSFWTTI